MAFQGDAFQNDAFQTGGTSVAAGVASGTGTASNASVRVSPNAAATTGTGAAYNATVTATVAAVAAAATGTGAASSASTRISPRAGAGTGTTAGYNATAASGNNVNATATTAAGTGAAYGATVAALAATNALAGVATGTGAGYNATAHATTYAAAGVAIGSGSAAGASVPSGAAHAWIATGNGAAWDASVAIPVVGSTAGTGVAPSVVNIIIGGVDYAPIIHFSTARFESLVNGQPGRGYMRLRDDDRTLSFTGGEPILIKVNGENVWRGFVTQPKRVYIAPALNIPEFGLTRFLDLECTDINILFKRRIVFNQSDPANGYTTLYGPGTSDLTALRDLFSKFIDLSGDGLNTTTLIENVADITVDQEGRMLGVGDAWGSAMGVIASLPGAIYYIDPDRNVVYTDVDTPNAPFGLSDVPNYSTSRGYSEMEVLKDGTVMANDVFAWGIGYNPDQIPVFVRETDATSVATHGTWQRGEVKFGIYKQATIDRVAESIVYGSPSNKRGSKDDRVSVALTTYEPGLRVAQKVTFTSNVFDFTDVIPVRKMVITFEAPDYPRYDILLSHDIDPPWSFVDPFSLALPGMPKPDPPEPPKPPPPKRVCVTVDGEGCIFDDFDRTISGSLGSTSATGQAWENVLMPTWPGNIGGITPGFVYAEKPFTAGSGGAEGAASVYAELTPIDLANRAVFQAPFTISTSVSWSTSQNPLEGSADLDIQVSSSQGVAQIGLSSSYTALPFPGYPSLSMTVGSNAGTDSLVIPWPGGAGSFASSTVRMVVTDTSVTLHAFGEVLTQSGNIGPLPGAISTLRDLSFSVGPSNMNQAMRMTMGPLVIESDFGVPMPWCETPVPTEECFDTFVGFPFSENITVTAGETDYSTSTNYQTGSLLVFLNGNLQRPDVDYTETSPSTGGFTLLFTPEATDQIRVIYMVGA